jgi:hypothetical protein
MARGAPELHTSTRVPAGRDGRQIPGEAQGVICKAKAACLPVSGTPQAKRAGAWAAKRTGQRVVRLVQPQSGSGLWTPGSIATS